MVARLKRMLDIVAAVALGIISLPVVAIAACAIRIADPGPIFFTQTRRGQCGKAFRLFKLRTMRLHTDSLISQSAGILAPGPDPRIYRSAADPRIIPVVGTFLRCYSIDELPQIWNLLIGDLTLVGPRPLPDYHARLLGEDFLALRESVKPGVTGLWQIKSRNQADPAAIERYDREYLANPGLWSDLGILLRTVVCVIKGKGI
jgi:lipopolysaccharide/colanic/teichoic acid biosynthesis glycosyltransferase